jgi:UDP-N-acetylmuramoyl-L-alanyl-D-glutamate--2,6-diaminopimelate ligase
MWQKAKNLYHLVQAYLANLRYGWPSRKLKVIGITGTDGKTTTTTLVYHILTQTGHKASMITTVYAKIGDQEFDTGLHTTTPHAFDIQKFLRKSVNEGMEYFVLETTSHALDQNRIFGVQFEVGLLTNVSHEHLDYHGTFEAYRRSKAKIIKNNKITILNKDDANFDYLAKLVKGKLITVSREGKADVSPKSYKLQLSIEGTFNIENALIAAAISSSLGIGKKQIEKAVSEFSQIPGHMEAVSNNRDIQVYIDFAHKPDALNKVLIAARELTKGKIIAVFGCAGLRDTEKRPMMGEIAAELCDFSVFTAEDPRTEDVKEITRQIANGAACNGMVESKKTFVYKRLKKSKHYFWRVYDRAEAIDFAINTIARKGDCVLLLGKGHEKSMCFGTVEHSWDEKKVAQKALLRKE